MFVKLMIFSFVGFHNVNAVLLLPYKSLLKHLKWTNFFKLRRCFNNEYIFLELFLVYRFFCIMIKLLNKIKIIYRNYKFFYLIFRCFLLLKWRELTWIISKNWIYYTAHNNTKYYLITSYLLGKPTNNRTRQKI